MNINPEYNEDSVANAQEAMAACMNAIKHILIIPADAHDLIDDEQAKILGTIAEALTIIARKAHAYEKMLDSDTTSPYTNN